MLDHPSPTPADLAAARACAVHDYIGLLAQMLRGNATLDDLAAYEPTVRAAIAAAEAANV